jgi:hypothetical protein
MLNSSPAQDSNWPPKFIRPAAIKAGVTGACLLFGLLWAASAQTLARPGWTASGFTADPWWKHAVFYQMTPRAASVGGAATEADIPPDWLSDEQSVSGKLDALQTLRIDALILPMPEEQESGARLDAFDDLVSQASRRGIRVVLALQAAGTSSMIVERARFWLSRGIAGFYVVNPPEGSAAEAQANLQGVRSIASSAVGGRIVISDTTAPGAASTAAPRSYRRRRRRASAGVTIGEQGAAQLRIESTLNLPELPDAATLRQLIAHEPRESNVMLDLQLPAVTPGTTDPYVAIMKSIAAIELATHPAALIEAGGALSPGGDDSATTDWYRQLIALHHGNATLRYGSATPLDFDSQNSLVWVSRASGGSATMLPVVVACNLTSSPVHLSLGTAVRGVGLRGSFLRTLLRTGDSMGPQDVDNVNIPAFGVYVGELRR